MTKPFLSVMHAKAHDWPCKVLYGSRLQDVAGMTSGDELELVNSNMSRQGFTTKRMTKSGTHDTLKTLPDFGRTTESKPLLGVSNSEVVVAELLTLK